MNKSRLGFRS